MKKSANLAALVSAGLLMSTLSGCGGGAETRSDFDNVDVTQPVTDWQLVWSDEFDGNSIDASKWTHEVNCAGGGNNEKQCYTDSSDNAYVANGILNIVALPAEEGAEKPYTSARLVTRNKADFKYGRIEMRAQLPFGQGSWPAFWMMPTDSVYGGWPRSGEIDILEAVNLKVVGEDGVAEANVHGTLHYGREWPDNVYSGKSYQLPNGVNPADDFHTYAIEWQEGEIRWYVDGYLYATQRQSEVRYNANGDAVGLSHRGWFAEYYNIASGELETHWDAAPFDQKFYLILNLAVGGNWPENVNNLGIDASAFTDGQRFQVDYIRVYECSTNPVTGKGCDTVRGGYDSPDDALVTGLAPIPTAASGLVQSLTIFDGTPNPNWAAWDCCGGTTPALVADAQRGDVYEFSVGATPTVNGFTSRAEFVTEPGVASPFDASGITEIGYIRFDMQVTSAPGNSSAPWIFKVESVGASTAVELELTASAEAAAPVTGQWQTYTFPLQALADAGLDVAAIDVVMVFPAWGQGEGAVYRLDNVEITLDYPELVLFADEANPDWPLWDCCGGSVPTEVMDDAEHGTVAQFSIGATPTVMGFSTRSLHGGSDEVFDASLLTNGGVVQFEMKVVSAPANAAADWLFKLEANGSGDGAVELNLADSVEQAAPVTGQWQTYTFNLADIAATGFDVSAIDVLMVFPAWGQGEGAVYRLDNVIIKQP